MLKLQSGGRNRRRSLAFLAVLIAVAPAFPGGEVLEGGETLVHGRVQYEVPGGGLYPVRFARVEVLDENGLDRPVRGYQASTDHRGFYEVAVDNEADADGSGADLRVVVYSRGAMSSYRGARSSVCNVIGGAQGLAYMISSPRYPDNRAGELEISFLVEQEDAGAWAVYDSVVEAFVKSVDLLGITNPALPGLVVWWPHAGRAHYNVRGLHLPEEKKWQRDLIFHEYGHHIETMVGFGDGDVGTNCHWRRCYDLREQPDCADPEVVLRQSPEQAMNLAFREAWPTLFAIASQLGDTGYPGSGDAYYDDGDFRISLEDLTGAVGRSPGEFYECQTLGALWDLFDDQGEVIDEGDSLSDTSPRFRRIWQVISRHRPGNIQEFWDGWVREWGGSRELARIFTAHALGVVIRPGDIVENDSCETASDLFLLPGGSLRVSGDTSLAGRDLLPCASLPPSQGTWHRFTGTGNRVRVSTCAAETDFDTRLSIFSGDCSGLACLGSNDDGCGEGRLLSTLELRTEAGAEYFILVSGFAQEAGSYVLQLRDSPPDVPEKSVGVGPFRRGDSNGDSRVDIADVSQSLGWLFLGGSEPPCLAAADSNTDGLVNIADVSWLLGWLFLGGPAPKAPSDCGPGLYATDDALGCERAACR